MEQAQKISVEQCCSHYSIEISFVQQLNDHGLISLIQTEKTVFIAYEQLTDLERYIHLYYDLEINMAGLDTIRHLLHRVQLLQNKVRKLENEL